jgi:hypothetical protein
MVVDHVKASQSPSSVFILSAIILGSEKSSLKPYLETISNVIADSDVCQIADVSGIDD